MGVRLGDRVGGVDRSVDRLMWDVDVSRLHWVGGLVDVDGLVWDNNWDHGGHGGSDDGAERGALGGGGTGLVGPGVVGEPAGGDEVLAGGVGGVHIAPLGPGTVHGHTVSLHNSVGVPEGQAATLTPAVDQRGGGLLTGGVLSLAAVSEKGAEEAEEDDVTAVLHGGDIGWQVVVVGCGDVCVWGINIQISCLYRSVPEFTPNSGFY